MNRREWLKATAALPLISAMRPSAAMLAMGWPAHTISMIVPFPAGGQADRRAVGAALQARDLGDERNHQRIGDPQDHREDQQHPQRRR